jgi:hypothetical protein
MLNEDATGGLLITGPFHEEITGVPGVVPEVAAGVTENPMYRTVSAFVS